MMHGLGLPCASALDQAQQAGLMLSALLAGMSRSVKTASSSITSSWPFRHLHMMHVVAMLSVPR